MDYLSKPTPAYDAWEMGKQWYGSETPANAQKAAQRMKREGWTFAGYDQTYGEELYHPPAQAAPTGGFPVWIVLIVAAVVLVIGVALAGVG